MQDYFSRFRLTDDFDEREFVGCSPEEISEFLLVFRGEAAFHEDYYSFLQWGGKRMAYFQPASDFFFPEICKLNASVFQNQAGSTSNLSRILAKAGLPKESLIVASHFDYEIYFSAFPSNPDIAIYKFVVADEVSEISKVASSFQDLINSWIAGFLVRHQENVARLPEIQVPFNRFKTKYYDLVELIRYYAKIDNQFPSSAFKHYFMLEKYLYDIYDGSSEAKSRLTFSLGVYKQLPIHVDQGAIGPLITAARELEVFFVDHLLPFLNSQ